MMSMLLSEMIAIIPLLAFQIRPAFNDAEKLLYWIVEYISRVSCLSRTIVCSQTEKTLPEDVNIINRCPKHHSLTFQNQN